MQFTTGSEFYLSDSFTFYLHISNESEQTAKAISVVVAIKDPQSNNRSVLDTSSTPKEKLDSQQQSDYIIRFHLSEPGSHVLGIKVQYTSHTGEVRSLTKHFKFTVSKPAAVDSSLVSTLPVRLRCPHLWKSSHLLSIFSRSNFSSCGVIVSIRRLICLCSHHLFIRFFAHFSNPICSQNGFLVKSIVTNLTNSFPLLLEQVKFECASPELKVTSLSPASPSLSQSQNISSLGVSTANGPVEDLSILDLSKVSVLRPGCSVQHLFEVAYTDIEKFDPKTITTLGQATASWRFPMGEPCSMSSSPIFVNFSSRKPFTFVISSMPAVVKAQQAFNLSFLIHNISNAPIRPRLVAVKSKMEGILISGLTGVLAPRLEPGESYTFNVKAIALEPGVQTLHGIRITELEKDKIYDLNNVVTVDAEL